MLVVKYEELFSVVLEKLEENLWKFGINIEIV